MSEPSANPLFLAWIKEWYDLAKERNSKGVNTYKKAHDSMKSCPLTFTHPSEAQQLDGIGPKICDRLTERLKQHCGANGLPMPKEGNRKRRTGEELPNGAREDEEPTTVKRPRRIKPYVPSLRSGAYALVLALSSVPEDSLQSLSKAEVIELAQPHCDSSFTVPSETNRFYTAWSSMKTLTDKDLVLEKGRPTRKYWLSDEGWVVARRIKAAQASNDRSIKDNQNSSNGMSGESKTSAPKKSISKAGSNDFVDLDEGSEQDIPVPTEQKRARTNLCERSQIGSTPMEPCGQRLGAKPEDQFDTFSSPRARDLRLKGERNIVDLLSSPEPLNLCRLGPKSTSRTDSQVRTPLEQLSPKRSESSNNHTIRVKQSTDRARCISSPTTTSLPIFDQRSVQSGSFIVQLVLDTREVRTKTDRGYIYDELVKKGVKPIVRALELGDFFWVAKMNDPSTLTRYGEEGDELALDWIVERKRLDDLVGSITDGRFSEQKFRLKRSGVKNVIYLIEEFSLSNEKETRFHEAIQSAIASTQVVNGYFVKKTQTLDDTIRYIARMTCMLRSIYESKPLHIIPTKAIEGENYIPLLTHLRTDPTHASRNYQVTYPTFTAISSKTDNLTLRDVYIKMLLCTRGISAEKALALQKVWPTPRALIEAFEACGTERERDTLVADTMDRVMGRAKIKGVLGQKVGRIWGEE